MNKIKNMRKGFSLTELMVVVAVIGLLGIVAVPNLVSGLPSYRLKSAARDLCSNMRKARSMAVKQNRNITITFDAGGNTYLIDGQSPWPQGYTCLKEYYGNGVLFGRPDSAEDPVAFDGGTVTFNEQGMSIDGAGQRKTGYVYLKNNKEEGYRIGVRTIAGNIVLQQWTGSEWK
jgi:type IV fimbrial biogenesis protein FimT